MDYILSFWPDALGAGLGLLGAYIANRAEELPGARRQTKFWGLIVLGVTLMVVGIGILIDI